MPAFNSASVYKTLQPWFKESMKRKVETVYEIEEKMVDAKQSMNRLPIPHFEKESRPFFSYVDLDK